MRLPQFTKKAIVVGAAAGIAVGAAGIAAAYFGIGGSGTGTATIGSPSTVTITGAAVSTLGPGAVHHVGFTADNTNSFTVDVGAVTITGISVTSTHSGCLTSWFTLASATTALGTLTPGAHAYAATTSTHTPTIELKTVSTNESACEGAQLTLALSAAAG